MQAIRFGSRHTRLPSNGSIDIDLSKQADEELLSSPTKSKSNSQRSRLMSPGTSAREKSISSLSKHSTSDSLPSSIDLSKQAEEELLSSPTKSKSNSQRIRAMLPGTSAREKSMLSLSTHSTASLPSSIDLLKQADEELLSSPTKSKSNSQRSRAILPGTSPRETSMLSLSTHSTKTHSTADSSPSTVASTHQRSEVSTPKRRFVKKKKPVTPPGSKQLDKLNPQEDIHFVPPMTCMTPKTKTSVIDASLPLKAVQSPMFQSPMTPTAYDSNNRLGVADYSARSGSRRSVISEGESRRSSFNAKTPTRSNDSSFRSARSNLSDGHSGHSGHSSPRKPTRRVENVSNTTPSFLRTPKTHTANFPRCSFATTPSMADVTQTPHVTFTPGTSEPRRPIRRNSNENMQGLLEQTGGLMEKMMKSGMTCLYECASKCDWDRVLHECRKYPRDAQYVCPRDGTTALHLAVMSRANPLLRDGELENYKAAPVKVIEELLGACPEAAIMRCSTKKYTPLTHACLVSDRGYDMEDGAEMVRIILNHAPESAYVFTDDGFSALDIHILSYSRFHEEKQEIFTGVRTSSVVVKTLLTEKPALADPRTYKHKVRGPLELLYRCNKSEFDEAMETEIGSGDPARKEKMKQRCASVTTGVLADWWAFKWTLMILKFSFQTKKKTDTPFSAVQAAARVVGCPLPILALVVHAFPEQVLDRDPREDIYNLPLHEVCSWRCDADIVSGDPFIIRRKAKAIRCLLSVNLDAARMTNNFGETSLQLAIESCTPWDGGLEDLVRACPKGLRFPRKLRDLPGGDGYAFSTPNQSAALSVCSDDSPTYDPVSAIDGMYPFSLAAVMSHVPTSRRKPPTFLYSDETPGKHENNLAQKDLESVRSIFGLLRASPTMLDRYRKDLMKAR